MIDKDPIPSQSPNEDTLKALLRVAARMGGANVTRNPDFAGSPQLIAIEEARKRATLGTDLPILPQTLNDELWARHFTQNLKRY